MTDLCDTCQHFRDGLHYNACQEEEAKELRSKTVWKSLGDECGQLKDF